MISKKQFLRYLKFSTIAIAVLWATNFTIGVFFLDFGTPIGILISKYKLDRYSQAVYGESVLPDGLPRYNPKNSDYRYKLIARNSEIASEIWYIPSKNMIIDTSIKFENDPTNEIDAIDNELGEDIYLPPALITYGIDGSQDFSQQPLRRIDKLYLLGIKNTNINLTPQQSKEEFFRIISFIYKKLGDKYHFTSSQIIYTDINGTLETSISAKESTMSFKNTDHKIKPISSGEMEKKLIQQLEAVRNGTLTKASIEVQDMR